MVAGWQGEGAASQLRIAAVLPTVPLAELAGSSRIVGESLHAFAALIGGEPERGIPSLRAAIAWASGVDDADDAMWGAWCALWIGDSAAFEALLDRAAALARKRGQIATLTEVLGIRAIHLALFARRPSEAAVAAAEAAELGRELGAGNILVLPRAALAIVAAIQGRDDEARELASRALEHSRIHEVRLRTAPARVAIAYCEMSAGRWRAA